MHYKQQHTDMLLLATHEKHELSDVILLDNNLVQEEFPEITWCTEKLTSHHTIFCI